MDYTTQYGNAQPYGYQPQDQTYAQPYPPQYGYADPYDPYANAQQYPQQEYPQQPAYGQQPTGYEQYPGYGQPPSPYEQYPGYAPYPYDQQQPPYGQQNPYEPQFQPAPPEEGKKGRAKKARKEPKPPKPDTAAKKVLRGISNVGFWVLCFALLAGSALFMLNKDPRKDYFGYRAYNVRSNSMAPNADGTSPPGGFYKGDTIIIQMCSPGDVKLNDIVTFNPNPNDEENLVFLTHRVVEIRDELGGKEGLFFVTKGDHNKSEDPPIAAASIIGKKVAAVPKVGVALELIRNHLAIAIVTVLALLGSVLMLQWYFAKPEAEAENQKAPKGKKGKETPVPAPIPFARGEYYPQPGAPPNLMQPLLPG